MTGRTKNRPESDHLTENSLAGKGGGFADYFAKLGFVPYGLNCFYKEVESEDYYNCATCLIWGGHFLSIKAGKVNEDRDRDILSGYYIESEKDIEAVLQRLFYLGRVIPEVVLVPSFDVVV